jgi:hypothetical protein
LNENKKKHSPTTSSAAVLQMTSPRQSSLAVCWVQVSNGPVLLGMNDILLVISG